MGNIPLSDCYLRCPIAVLLEGGVLVGVGLVFVVELVDDGTAEHSFALTMDEHDLLSFMVLMLSQCAVNDVELVTEDVGGTHARGGFKDLVGMQINNNWLIAFAVLGQEGILGFAIVITTNILRGYLGLVSRFLVVHLLLQFLSIDHQRTVHLVILDYSIK